ncbi:hypothetical protein [Aquiflexum balticum]|nr:hypothetical protein [Aquiflexum balticum]
MSKYEFLSLASESDSLTAVVNMFFRKRKSSTTAGWIVAGSATVISIVVGSAQATGQTIGAFGNFISGTPLEETNNSGGTIFLVGLAGGAAITTIGRSTYTKNKLYNVITEYQDTNKIPYQYASKLVPKDFYFKSR